MCPPNMHHESELIRQKTEEDLAQPDDDVSTGSDTSTVDQSSTGNVAIVNFLPGEPADPHNWSMVRFEIGACYMSEVNMLIIGKHRQRRYMSLLWDLCCLL